MRFLLAIPVTILLSATAAAQDKPVPPVAAPLRIVIPIVEPKCETSPPTEGVILVCGLRDERYRIDPVVLAATRSRDSRGGPRAPSHGAMFNEGCSGIGLARCPGQNVVPVSSILLVAATALIKVAKGEDLRPMLHTVPSEYDLYKEAKADAEAESAAAAE